MPRISSMELIAQRPHRPSNEGVRALRTSSGQQPEATRAAESAPPPSKPFLGAEFDESPTPESKRSMRRIESSPELRQGTIPPSPQDDVTSSSGGSAVYIGPPHERSGGRSSDPTAKDPRARSSEIDLSRHSSHFGQELGHWRGVGSSPRAGRAGRSSTLSPVRPTGLGLDLDLGARVGLEGSRETEVTTAASSEKHKVTFQESIWCARFN